jgi:serine/threonine protein kinase
MIKHRKSNNTKSNTKSNIVKYSNTGARTLKNDTSNQNGGKYLDKGGFGCVITPALKCSNKDKNVDKMVSKIIPATDKDFYNELRISQMLKKLDPSKKYYLTFEKYCYINNIPKDRDDLENVHFLDDEFSKYELIDSEKDRQASKTTSDRNRDRDKDRDGDDHKDKIKDKSKIQKRVKDEKTCKIEIALKPVNLVMDYGGYSLSTIMKINRKQQGTKAKMHQIFIDNLRIYFKHLILGIIKMHFNRIVNRDIKPRNIMMNWNKDNNTVQIRYIDFGLSDFLSNEFCSSITNIRTKGTPTYYAPELVVSYLIRKYRERSPAYIIGKIFREIDDNVKKSMININEKESSHKSDDLPIMPVYFQGWIKYFRYIKSI